MGQTSRGYTFPSDYKLEADVPKAIKKLAEDIDLDVGKIDEKLGENGSNLRTILQWTATAGTTINSLKEENANQDNKIKQVEDAIPENVSQLNNDSKFQTEEQVSEKIGNAIKGVTQFDYQVVDELPQEGVKGTIYLKPNQGEKPNIYDEYLWIGDSFELIATTEIDLSDYYKKSEVDQSQKSQDQRIENLENDVKKKIEEYLALIEKSANAVSGVGEEVTLKDTVDSRFKKLQVGGNSVQKTREGYNQIDIRRESYGSEGEYTFVNNKDGTATLNGTRIGGIGIGDVFLILNNTDFSYTLKPNVKYTLFIECLEGTLENPGNIWNLSLNGYLDGQYKSDLHYLNWRNLTSKGIVLSTFSPANEENVTAVKLYLPAGATFNNYKFRVGLYEGDYTKETLPPWQPYGVMPSPEFQSAIRNCGDNVNLFDSTKKADNYALIWSSGNVVTSEKSIVMDFMPANLFKKVYSNYNFYIFFYDKDKGYLGNGINVVKYSTDGETFKEIEIPKNDEIAFFRILYRSNRNDDLDMTKIEDIIISATKISSYAPYGCGCISVKVTDDGERQQSKTFPLQEGQVLHIGDYLASDGIHQTESQYALTGSETYQYFSTDEDGNAIAVIFTVINQNMDYFKPALCNMLKFSSVSNFIKNSFYFIPGNKGIRFKLDDTIKTVDEFKAFIKQKYDEGNPFIIQYKLTEEEITPYTPEQQKAYNELMEMTSYEDMTYVFSENEISPIFDITAYAKGTNTVQEQTVQSEPTLEPPTYEEPLLEDNQYFEEATFEKPSLEEEGVE